MLTALALWPTSSVAQDTAILQAPPKIPFAPWREIRVDEFSREMEASFPSAITSGVPENDIVRVNTLLPIDRVDAVPAVVILHYWGASDLFVERRMAQRLNRRGIAAVIMTLPYHMQRTPAGRLSGELAIQPNIPSLIQTMVQSVSDARRTIDWIETRPEFAKGKVGICGTSLGAIVSTLTLAVEPRIGPSCFFIGGTDIAHILWNSSRTVSIRDDLRRRGYTEDRLREELAIIEPTPRLLSRELGPSLVVTAEFDTVVPSKSADTLIHSLDSPTVIRLKTGHFGGVLAQRSLLNAQSEFFHSYFSGETLSLNRIMNAPTIQLGTMLSSQGLEVFAGLQVYHNKRARTSASILITPRTLSGFVGFQADRYTSIGLTTNGRHTSPGVIWRVVL